MNARFHSDALYLALETSGPLGSVAVGSGERVLARAFLDRQGRHAADLIPRIADSLAQVGAGARDLAGVVVGAGPGSFTGVRVAAATAKGIAHALELPLWSFSSLEAAAISERVIAPLPGSTAVLPWPHGTERVRYVLFDARGDRLYAACYGVIEDGVEERIPPHATDVGALLDENVPEDAWFVGDGAVRHEALLQAGGRSVLPPPAGIPTADGLIHLLALHQGRPPVDNPARWEPEYMKAPSAERARVG